MMFYLIETGEPVHEFTNTVMGLAAFFQKDFKPALLNGQKCLGSHK